MSLWFAIVLGIVQGLTEFVPISSTAHLRIVPHLLGQPDPGAAFTAVVQLGTLVAVIAYFIRDLLGTARAAVTAPRSQEARLLYYLVAGTIPIGIAGLAFKRHITGELRTLIVIAFALMIVGVIMGAVDLFARGKRAISELSLRDALIVGTAQALALIPGVSRSGATITCALVLGFARPDAARLSFLLSVPAIAAAGIFELRDALHGMNGGAALPLLVSTLVAGLVGYASIAWLLRWLRTRSLAVFAVYRILLGVFLLLIV